MSHLENVAGGGAPQGRVTMGRVALMFALAATVLAIALAPRVALASGLYKQYNASTHTLTYIYGDGTDSTFSKEDVKKVVVDPSVSSCSTKFTFAGLKNATVIEGLSNVNTAGWTDFRYLFDGCSSLTSLDLSGWDTSSVETLGEGSWTYTTTGTTDTPAAFRRCSSLRSINLSGWNVSNVTSLSHLFEGCSSLTELDLSGWDTSNVKHMQYVFSGCSSLKTLNLSGWDTSSARERATYLWEGKAGMFSGCSSLTQLTVGEKFSFSVYAGSSISTKFGLRSDVDWLSSEDGKVYATNAIPSNVAATYTAADRLYKQYDEGTQTLTYKYGEGIDSTYKSEDVKRVVVDPSIKNCSTSFNFSGLKNATVIEGLGNVNTSNWTSLESMFRDCKKVTSLDLGGWDTQKVTNMRFAFHGCKSLTSLNVSNWKTGAVTDMISTFYGCESLRSLDLSQWDTSNVTAMNSMLCGCTSLESLDVSKWKTGNVTHMGALFASCSSLRTIDVSKWDTSKVTSMGTMFVNCASLASADVSNFDTSKVDNMSQMFAGASSITSLDFSNWNTSSVRATGMTDMLNGCTSLNRLTLGNRFAFPKGSGDTKLRSDVSWRSSADGKTYAGDAIPSNVAATYTAVAKSAPAKKTEMYRLYNPNSGEHFYTSNAGERDHLKSVGWTDEGKGWNAPARSNTPVYRLYNPNAGEHHYAMSKHERDELVRLGWTDEGIGWYSDDARGVKLYRLYNPNAYANNHHYTLSANEHDTLVAMGWRDEGAAWYGVK